MDLVQIYKYFPTKRACIKHLEKIRWNDEPICPYCQSKAQTPLKKEQRYHCNICNTSYSVTVGTIFHKSRVDLQKWFVAIFLILNSEKYISSRALAATIKVSKDTAWKMKTQIEKVMIQQHKFLSRIVGVDKAS